MNNQKTLLRIVQTWSLNPKPEYRGFRCANCQEYMKKAWYHWLVKGGYKTLVHFCNQCENAFKLNKIKTVKPVVKVDRSKFLKFPDNVRSKLKEAVDGWNTKSKPVYRIFSCDRCGKNMYKAYHIWNIQKGILVEVHFCRKCGDKTGLKKI